MNNELVNQLTFRILTDRTLSENQRALRLARLETAVSNYKACKVECPECGNSEPKDHNDSKVDPTWLCECGHQFEDTGFACKGSGVTVMPGLYGLTGEA